MPLLSHIFLTLTHINPCLFVALCHQAVDLDHSSIGRSRRGASVGIDSPVQPPSPTSPNSAPQLLDSVFFPITSNLKLPLREVRGTSRIILMFI